MAYGHGVLERHSLLLTIGILLVVSIGGLVEIAPLFWLSSTIEKVEGMRPYSPLELAGRNIYIREGCYLCHSQQIRSLRDEIERYGHYSLAAESMYDHPFQWGSKRTGPDLARVGGKFSDEWHKAHMKDPRAMVPKSVMPGYPFLAQNELKYDDIEAHMKAVQTVDSVVQGKGVPIYTDEHIKNAKADLEAQAAGNAESEAAKTLLTRYPKAVVRPFDGDPKKITELDALVAYLQMLGTLVDFAKFDHSGPNLR
ncbi:MAG: cytochrome-c oxidase, cbb3-type subunit II [Alphaproteobacteria bacterium]